MKIALKLTAAALALLAALHTGYKIGTNNSTNTYPLAATVCEVDYNEDTVTYKDYNGNLWTMTGAEDWMEGDTAALLMDDHGTDLIYDDEIVAARYCGYNG